MPLELLFETAPNPAVGVGNADRFEVIVEYADGIRLPKAAASTTEEAIEAFLARAPGCENGEITLVDREEKRVVASVTWEVTGTELGLRVPHRQIVFHDWRLALIALEVQQRQVGPAAAELSAQPEFLL